MAYTTEEEQIEQLKTFVKRYGVSIILGILIAIVAMYGFRYWKSRQAHIAAQASSSYSQLLNGVIENKTAIVTRQANYLIKEYPKTPYAAMASLFLAKLSVQKNQEESALKHLQWIIKQSNQSALIAVARLRRARIFLSQKKYQQALNEIKPVTSTAFQTVKSEITGDIMLAMGKPLKAKEAYQRALQTIHQHASMKPVLEMKLDDVSQA